MWKFIPILKQTIWGGKRIATLKGLTTGDVSIGESWEISSLPGSVSVVAEGSDKGDTITQLIQHRKARLLGNKNYAKYGDEFPLLIKFIDAEKDLSIQVHPDEQMAKRYNQRAKTEMWYVVDADENTRICSGFHSKVDSLDYIGMIESGTIEEALNYIQIKKDDVFYIPAGRIHAIGAGAFLVEVQQASDVTYRVYDYMRKDSEGNLRELHVEKACEALDFNDVDAKGINYEKQTDKPMMLMRNDCFTVKLYRLTERYVRDMSELDSFVVLIATEGECEVSTKGENICLKAGETLLIEAEVDEYIINPKGKSTIVETYIANE